MGNCRAGNHRQGGEEKKGGDFLSIFFRKKGMEAFFRLKKGGEEIFIIFLIKKGEEDFFRIKMGVKILFQINFS